MSLIEDYLKYDNGRPTTHTIRCFVGMIETGEITWDELRNRAGDVITASVANLYNDIHDANETTITN